MNNPKQTEQTTRTEKEVKEKLAPCLLSLDPKRLTPVPCPLPLVLSPTQLTTYMSCPLKYYYRYVLKIEPEARSVFLAFGSAIHSSLAYYWKSIQKGKKISQDELLQAFLLDWEIQNTTPIDFNGDDPQELEEKGVELLNVYYEDIGERPEENVTAVERSFKVPVENPLTDETLPDVSLYGKIDLMLDDTIVEHKTAKIMLDETKAAEDVQLSCYAFAYHAMYKHLPNTLRFDVLLKQKKPRLAHVETSRTLPDLSRLYRIITQVVKGIQSQIFFPCYSYQCANCEYNKPEYCKGWGRKMGV